MHEVSIFGALIIGVAAGWIAEQVMHRKQGLLANLIVGIVGAFLGALLANIAGIDFAGFWGSLIVSTFGAVVLLWIVGMARRRSNVTFSALTCRAALVGRLVPLLLVGSRSFSHNGPLGLD